MVTDGERIAALPRRTWSDAAVDTLTARLRTPAGRQRLRPIQAAVLSEVALGRGVFCQGRVGCGKTLIAGLAPVVARAKRPTLLIPADGEMHRKTLTELARYRRHWRVPDTIRIVTYQALGLARNAHLLDAEIDLLIADEAQALRYPERAACARRVARFFAERQCQFLALSGSPSMRGELIEYGHMLAWALGDGSPAPLRPSKIATWSYQIQTDDPRPEMVTAYGSGPGTLAARYGDRLRVTPGVVISTDHFDGPLTINTHVLRVSGVDGHFARLRDDWEAPDGYMLGDARFQIYRAARQLALGFCYRQEPRPSPAFLRARKVWGEHCREIIERGGLDSEGQVVEHLAEYPAAREAHAAWIRARNAHPMSTVADWYSLDVIRWATAWAARGPGLVWTSETAFGRALASTIGAPYYGQQSQILDEDGSRIVVVSQSAHTKGFNLQCFNRNLFLSPSASAAYWEQRIGRTHRDGQERPVTVDVLVSCAEHITAIDRALVGAQLTVESTGQRQKILDAGLTAPNAPGDGRQWG